jgi:hypothetical protein
MITGKTALRFNMFVVKKNANNYWFVVEMGTLLYFKIVATNTSGIIHTAASYFNFRLSNSCFIFWSIMAFPNYYNKLTPTSEVTSTREHCIENLLKVESLIVSLLHFK